jgi:hypothetical protein
MAKRKIKNKSREADSAYFLKIVLYLIVSSMWLRIQYGDVGELPIPVGAAIALLFAMHDHFQLDRKIEYALILVSMFAAFWLPVGIYLSV